MATSRIQERLFSDDKRVNSTLHSTEVSFRNLKIDYSRCLGIGRFGSVYKVVSRPADEGWLSYYAPYIYDWIFPANNSMTLSTEYCVKINHSSFRIFNQVYNNHAFFYGMIPAASYAFNEARRSFREPSEQKAANHLLRKYNISQITIFDSSNIYAQFKTLVRGETFNYYLHGNYFISSNEFELRRSFVKFFNKINTPKLSYSDMHGGNIMYDEFKKIWDAPDIGVVEHNEKANFDSQEDNISWALKGLLSPYDYWDELSQAIGVINELARIARTNDEYTIELDQKILADINCPANNTASENSDDENISFSYSDATLTNFIVQGTTKAINWLWENAANKRPIANEGYRSWEKLNIR